MPPCLGERSQWLRPMSSPPASVELTELTTSCLESLCTDRSLTESYDTMGGRGGGRREGRGERGDRGGRGHVDPTLQYILSGYYAIAITQAELVSE